MEQIEDAGDELDDDEPGTSKVVRHLLDEAAEVDELRNRVDELRGQLAAANSRIDAANDVVEYARGQQSLVERRASAGVLTRLKWWATGMETTNGEVEG
jgi:chromosome segregation ATPase